MDGIISSKTPQGEIINALRQMESYQIPSQSSVDGYHPFHKRYSTKPLIYVAAIAGIATLTKFSLGQRMAESLEIMDAGMTKTAVVLLNGQELVFRTPLEVECFIADHLAEE